MSESPVTITIGAGRLGTVLEDGTLVTVLEDGTKVGLGRVTDFRIASPYQSEVLIGTIELEGENDPW